MPMPPQYARLIARALGGQDSTDRADALAFRDAGHGYDAFGMHPDFIGMADAITGVLHKHYFRVRSVDAHNIPQSGAAILAANHSGSLPFDGMMLWADVVRHTSPPRPPRPVADYFVSTLPWIGTLFARGGVVGGSRGNVRRLLEQGELLMLFPEGTPGIGKPFSERYRLQEWRKGHVELAIRHRACVVPVGIVGAEEQMPQLVSIPVERFGLPMPYLPIMATPLPLPVRYHILYGEPIRFDLEHPPEAADDPDIVTMGANRVRDAVNALLHRGLRERQGIFR